MNFGTLVAHRTWDWNPDSLVLRSPQTSTLWMPGEKLTARCLAHAKKHDEEGHIPGHDCTCGVHGWRSSKLMPRYLSLSYDRVPVFGQVSLWGRFIECERGYRAEHAYPYEFLLLPSHAEHAPVLRELFMIDVKVLSV